MTGADRGPPEWSNARLDPELAPAAISRAANVEQHAALRRAWHAP